MQKITPFLWFDGKAEEAMNFYVSIFQKFKDREYLSIWRGRANNGGDLPTQWPGIFRAKRRPAIHLLARHIFLRDL